MCVRIVFLVGLAGLLGQGCDTAGIYPLGVPVNTVSSCGKSTWARSTDDGTELFLLSETEPTTPVGGSTDAGVAASNCFVRMFIAHDSSTTMEQGTYTLGADGVGVFSVEHGYTFVFEDSSVPLGSHEGASRDDTPTPSSHPIEIEVDGDQILLGMDGDVRRLTNLYDVVARLDPSTQAGAEDVFRVLNLGFYSAVVRVPAFGSTGMTAYINNATSFTALVANEFTVAVALGKPVTDITFDRFEDLNGVVIDGVQRSSTNFTGSGDLSGVLEWWLHGSDDPGDIAFSGTLGYEGVHVKNGVADSGEYTLTTKGYPPFAISASFASDIDIRALLPVETP
jgi:hypothetical protein